MIFKHKRSIYRITTDQYQFILCRGKQVLKEGIVETEWTTLGYYNDVYYLLLKLLKLGCMEDKTAKDLYMLINNTLESLKKSILTVIDRSKIDDLIEGRGKVAGNDENVSTEEEK